MMMDVQMRTFSLILCYVPMDTDVFDSELISCESVTVCAKMQYPLLLWLNCKVDFCLFVLLLLWYFSGFLAKLAGGKLGFLQ